MLSHGIFNVGLYYGKLFLTLGLDPQDRDSLSTMDNRPVPTVSIVQRFTCSERAKSQGGYGYFYHINFMNLF